MRIRLAGLALALSALLPASMSAAPANAQPGQPVEPAAAQPIPDGPAKAWLVADLDTGRVLASRDPYGTYAPASTIKVLLAMTVLDHLRPDNFARANESHTRVECSCVGLKPGQAYTTTQLLSAILMVSGNDAANMLGDMLGGQQMAVAKMNRKAALVGARSTKASSPSGLDGPGWESVTTPHDLAVIMRAALKYPLIAQIMRSPTAPFPGKTLHNQNELLSRYPGDLGGKTGFTNLARKTYVGAAQRGNRRLVVVQMYGTGDLYGQAIRLLDYGFSQP
ncbi:putative penicillin-binding protein DacB2 (D-alanyl-D-alanine carboxypeptidase) (DD-peptidase) (DD-carboxypeptidase) (PBP) (DD-transpeptidase) (serine-type D-ala-D-ala carboxypeptidase) (D-amino acid hydrolase) [Mycobacterium tuberculosis H37Rv] [Mycolicibacterium parafortuitum]|uniref:Peptidase S11 D-alanyl-D-alanine carboxypeptidase A N-terminal domain-containing protein n=2 Tax=Mycolicibacterium parafortuitum TaxID=39692 RepID=A0A375YJC2_MYCPF|nr:serine hydrolase [Mycolicibacterium parafortuitum]SRX81246.1 putative penicillin-binding protein DacB2 (D-alanyl-D-alanine carboxypeptidase) (DD-peptidase) (DD-carboxypeptidase) (PBP) (DD-transpeptidase) (serine-type D-ala-D-ala carboxypeptidase) (D-amino acid hydrolase) [Mycobacterium tuberculosis H37Rv] [Mycolicibacterium parafortuitum]